MTNPTLYFEDGAQVPEAQAETVTLSSRGTGTLFLTGSCSRCGGTGIYSHYHGTCYRCGGIDPRSRERWSVTVRTAEAQARLEASRAKTALRHAHEDALAEDRRRDRFNAWLFECVGQRGTLGWLYDPDTDLGHSGSFLSQMRDKLDRHEPLSPAQLARVETNRRDREDAEAAGHFGEVGERYRRVTLDVQRRQAVESAWGTSCLVAGTIDGCPVAMFTTAGGAWSLEPGDQVVIDCTVKEHSTYRGVPQTKLSRPRFHESDVEMGVDPGATNR